MDYVHLTLRSEDAVQLLRALDERAESWWRTVNYWRTGVHDDWGGDIEQSTSESEATDKLRRIENLAETIRRQVNGR